MNMLLTSLEETQMDEYTHFNEMMQRAGWSKTQIEAAWQTYFIENDPFDGRLLDDLQKLYLNDKQAEPHIYRLN